MAERLKENILEKKKAVDLVCGPDAYKDLPRLLSITHSGQNAGEYVLFRTMRVLVGLEVQTLSYQSSIYSSLLPDSA